MSPIQNIRDTMTAGERVPRPLPVGAEGVHRFEALGTAWQIDTAQPLTAATHTSIARLIEQFDQTWSRFRDDSVVAEIARRPGSYKFGPEAPALFDHYRALYEATDGRMNPLVGRALEESGYNRALTLRRGPISPIPRFSDAVAWDGDTLTTLTPVVLDIGAAGKGYLVDLIAAHLIAVDIPSFTIDASGDIVHRGPRPLRVALEHPHDTTRAVGVATVTAAICASASNRRAWADTHHILDGVTGAPVRDVLATWVIAGSGLIADGLATALFVAPPETLANEFDFEYVRMLANGTLEASNGFDGELFP